MLENTEKIWRIGIDARFFGPKGKGLGRYVQQLITRLEKADGQNKYFIFLTKENWTDYTPLNKNFVKVVANFGWYGIKEQIYFPWLIAKYRLDLMHFPHFNVPIFCPVKFVMTVHDLILHRYPTRRATTLGPTKWRLKNIGYRLVFWIARLRARKIIAVSNFTKQDMQEEFNINDDKVVVIYEGPNFSGATQSPWQGALFNKNPYFLYVGNAYPHKNLEMLLDAFAKVNINFPQFGLVLVGGHDYFYDRLKEYEFKRKAKRVIFAGEVADENLADYYKKAFCFVLPSLYEGFGLTGLEAMSFDLPVISSSAASLPEIFGKAALYFNPKNVDELVATMCKMCQNQSLRDELIKKGHEQIKKYSWDEMAEQTLAVYHDILINPRT